MLTDITLGQYYPGSSVIHGLDPCKNTGNAAVYCRYFLCGKHAFLRSFGIVCRSGHSAFAPAGINGAAQRKASVDYYFAYAVYPCFYG